MSSEGSISNGSRIRQFGLYRSIDSRTEEFLRLSRKRQIRQGCACAAVSTAITVTVVVVMFFVYEFSLKSEMSIEDSLRANWFSLVNDTTNEGFPTNYSKSEIDRTTLTLLPILLKALQNNEFLKQIIEEQSSSSPVYDNDDEEYTFDKKSQTKNWFRNPSSKLYSKVFKTTPIDYYGSPKNLEYFRRVTKIRDYQRILAYVDKMINERVYIGSTRPTIKETFSTKPKIKPKAAQVKFKNKIPSKENVYESKTPDKGINCTCNCTEHFDSLLDKILMGFEKLLSLITSSNKITTTECTEKNVYVNRRPKTTTNYQQTEKHNDEQITNVLEPIKRTESYKNLLRFESTTVIFNDHDDARNTARRFFMKPVINNKYYHNKIGQPSISNNIQWISPSKEPVKPNDENEYDENLYQTETYDNFINNRMDIISSQRDNRIKLQDVQSSEGSLLELQTVNTDFTTIETSASKNEKKINFGRNYKMVNVNSNIPMQITSSKPTTSKTIYEDMQVHLESSKATTDKTMRSKNKQLKLKSIKAATYGTNPLKEDAQEEQKLVIPKTSIPLREKYFEKTKTPLLLFSTYDFMLDEDKQMKQKQKKSTIDKPLYKEDIHIQIKPIIASEYKKNGEQKEIKPIIFTTEEPYGILNKQKAVKPITADKILLKIDTQHELISNITTTNKPLHHKGKQVIVKTNNISVDEIMHEKNIQDELTRIISTAYKHLHEQDKQTKFKPLVPIVKKHMQTEHKPVKTTVFKHLLEVDTVKVPQPMVTTINNSSKKLIPTTDKPLHQKDLQVIIKSNQFSRDESMHENMYKTTINHSIDKFVRSTDGPLPESNMQVKLNTLISTTDEPLGKENKEMILKPIIATTINPLFYEEIQANLEPHTYMSNTIMHEEDIQEELKPIIAAADELLCEENEINKSKLSKDTLTKPILNTSLPTIITKKVMVENYTKQSIDVFQEERRPKHAGNPEVAWNELESEHLSALEALILPNSQTNKESDSSQKDQLQDYDFNILTNFDITD